MPAIDSQNTILIALIVLVFFIIIIIGVIVSLVARRSRNAQSAEPRREAIPAHPRLQEILRLCRDLDTGRVVTEFQGRVIRDPRTLSRSERDYLVRLAKDWTSWLGIPEPQPAVKVEPAQEYPIEAAASAGSTVEPEPASSMVTPVVAAGAVAAAQANPPALPIAPVTPVVTPLPEPPTPRSIVQQVDDILQEKLASHPVPVPIIRLVEDSQQGVVVWLNTTKYVGIESVTDQEARALIRSAVV